MDKMILSPAEISSYVEEVGVKKATNKAYKTFLLAVLAGIFIALGGFAAGMASHTIENMGVSKVIAGIVFPVGLILVLICGAELFTGNNLLTVAFFKKKITFKQMMKNWTIVFFGNMVGAVSLTTMLYLGGALKPSLGTYAIKVASYKCGLDFTTALFSGILCNIVVCLAVWGSYAAKDVTGKIFIGFFPIMAFVIAGFEHSIANMYYLTAGYISKMDSYLNAHSAIEKMEKIDLTHIISNLIPVTLGNIIGGGIIIGGIYYLIYLKESN
ncbi:MAG: formate/nitrite transporter family protein [Clostridia bacterium]|jgi:formate/nitrite transporter|nr:formate/nitrite transporter family protein [Clostridia bacterium]